MSLIRLSDDCYADHKTVYRVSIDHTDELPVFVTVLFNNGFMPFKFEGQLCDVERIATAVNAANRSSLD